MTTLSGKVVSPPRSNIRTLHKYIGLTAGVIVVFQALTGSIVAFYEDLDYWFASELYRVEGEPTLSISDVENVVREANYPGRRVSSIYINSEEDNPHAARAYLVSADPNDPTIQAFVDTSTGTINGDRVMGQFCWSSACLMPFILQLHLDFTIGEPGRWIMGAVGLLWTGTIVIGFILTLPRVRRRFWRQWLVSWKLPSRPAQGPPRRVLFGLHRAVALWTLPIAALLAITGFALALKEQVVAPVMTVISPVTESLLHERYVSEDFSKEVTLQEALEVARPAAAEYARANGTTIAAFNGVGFAEEHGGYDVFFTAADAKIPNRGFVNVSVDASTGAVMDVRNELGRSASDAVLAWLYPLHSGLVLGFFGHALIALTGVLIVVYGTSGVWLWWSRRRAARAASVSRARGLTDSRSVTQTEGSL